MSRSHPVRRGALTVVLVLAFLLSWASPGVAGAEPWRIGGSENQAVAVNTTDGASVFRLAFSVQYVTDGVVDQTNEAYALASCVDCQTVALAFQVVLVSGNASVVTPENRAVAYNDQCTACLTYASATQLVLGVDGPVRLTGEGMSRLMRLWVRLRQLEDRIGELDAAELHAEVAAAKAELLSIFTDELVPIGPPQQSGPGTDPVSTTSTASTAPSSVTTTTAEPATTTTSTEPVSPSTSAPAP